MLVLFSTSSNCKIDLFTCRNDHLLTYLKTYASFFCVEKKNFLNMENIYFLTDFLFLRSCLMLLHIPWNIIKLRQLYNIDRRTSQQTTLKNLFLTRQRWAKRKSINVKRKKKVFKGWCSTTYIPPSQNVSFHFLHRIFLLTLERKLSWNSFFGFGFVKKNFPLYFFSTRK